MKYYIVTQSKIFIFTICNKINLISLFILMKRIVILFFIFLTSNVSAQFKGDVLLNWKEKNLYSTSTKTILIPNFDENFFRYDEVRQLISFEFTTPIAQAINENSLRISNINYQNISVTELGSLKKESIPTTINAKAENIISRDINLVRISLNPIIKDGMGYKKVVSFSYELSPGINPNSIARRDFNSISNSKLAVGDWYRFYVEKSGVYKISKSFLQQLGMNGSAINPNTIKIYGSGGSMVPLRNAVEYPADLEENAIQVIGGEDGSFDNNDYILFYAEGVDNWSQENRTHNNLYTDRAYYYVTNVGGIGKRISTMPVITNATTIINTFDDYQFHENDLVNLGRLGRIWFGEQFGVENTRSFEFKIPNVVTTENINVQVSTAFVGLQSSGFTVEINSTNAGNINLSAPGDLFYTSSIGNFTANASENVIVKLSYNNNGIPSNRGYLDYIILRSKRKLQGYGKQFRFQYDAAATIPGVGEYQFSNASTIDQVWDVTDIYNVVAVKNENQNNFSFRAGLGEIRKYIAIDRQDFFTPKKESNARVANQNIKGTILKNSQGQFQDVDYLIITPAFLNSSAEKLAQFHRTNSNLVVKVVSLENIYQEFSSGKQDVGAIRNFVKYVYNNASSDNKRVKYLNLFGDASYDFKNRISNNTNIVPIYHSVNGATVNDASHCSDDFFVMMDFNEGGGESLSGRADIAVGRMIVSTVAEADAMVQKVIDYHDVKSFGNWRNNYTLVADDPDQERTGDRELQYRQNVLAEKIKEEKPFINVYKIFIDSYVQEAAGGGFRYPKAREAFFEAFQRGSLVINYLGHGGEDGLAVERIWDKTDSQNLYNQYKLPLFITLTCEFSRFDNPNRITAGELTYLNPKGGAIAMITTVREIGQGTAQNMNDALAKNLLSYGDNNYPSIAEALRLTKNTNNSNVVFFIGDPAIHLPVPKPKIILTKVNDTPVDGQIDDLKSLATIKLSGQIVDENNNLQSNYNGALAVNIYDKEIDKLTLRNDFVDAMIGYDSNNNIITVPYMPFKVLGETIFRGNASVTNGQFDFTFVIPRDIRIPLGNGRISFYAKRNNQLLDHTGYNQDIKVGGINENAAVDNTPPRVRLYMNDESFISGGITNESPIFLAFMEDENGMNTASGIGHDMVAILDGDETNPYILNDFYETELDDYTKGKIKFPFRNLKAGLHTLTFKAWDVYNNLVTAEIQFVVVGDETLTLTNVLNYPNPFVSYTQFWFTHNRPFEPLDVQVQVMTVTGKIVWTKNQVINTEGFLSREITWDGRDDFGDKIGKGVYIYKLTVRSSLTNTKTEKFEKLVIL